jgi:hypothetical protein
VVLFILISHLSIFLIFLLLNGVLIVSDESNTNVARGLNHVVVFLEVHHFVLLVVSLLFLLNGILLISNELNQMVFWHLIVFDHVSSNLSLLNGVLIISDEFVKFVSFSKSENKCDKCKFVHFNKYYYFNFIINELIALIILINKVSNQKCKNQV